MKFDIILADPPWSFKTWSDAGQGKGAIRHYPTMGLDDICNLDVGKLAAENCALFMWGVWPSMFDTQRVMESWGFKYRTVAFVWVKSSKIMTDADSSKLRFHFGLGYYTRSNTEFCLLAVKGKMPVASHSVSQVIYSPVRNHSQKPDEQYGLIDALYPNTSKLELFCRVPRPGWSVWGNEVKSDVVVDLKR
jgi:N6-adenosine-specific RNA methylase IME4